MLPPLPQADRQLLRRVGRRHALRRRRIRRSPTRSDNERVGLADRPCRANAEVETIEPCPGSGRMLAVAAGFDGAFWLLGGVGLGSSEKMARSSAATSRTPIATTPKTGWKRIADLPHPVAAAPSPAPVDATGFYVLGGDDGSQVGCRSRQTSRV